MNALISEFTVLRFWIFYRKCEINYCDSEKSALKYGDQMSECECLALQFPFTRIIHNNKNIAIISEFTDM